MPVPQDGCFHCGLPLPPRDRPRVLVAGVARELCCAGCAAVAQAIVAGGFENYYEQREAAGGVPPALPAELAAELALYDDPQVQRGFVRELAAHEREAALLLEGISCAACIWLIERRLKALPGVGGVEVNYATRRARVRWDERRHALSEILTAIAEVGYRGRPYDAARADDAARRERRDALWRLAVAGLGMMQVMMYAVPAYIAGAGDISADLEWLLQWASLALTLPVVLYSAASFYRNAWRDLAARRVGMDVPVALGISVAFGASLYATLTGHGEVYYDSVTMFVFLLLGGRYLESQARARALRSTEAIARLAPALAERLPDWPGSAASESVAVARLAVGDHVLVRPGAPVPADAVVVDGTSEVDEALVTGESRPVPRRPGDALVGGAVNRGAPLVARVERIGEQTVLAGIVRLLDRAASERPEVAVLADRYAMRFVLLILATAALAALVWGTHDPGRAIAVVVAVLVITCPCALSLATPTALAVAAGELARSGLLVTRGHAIETLARATHVVLDKTGTLTRGALELAEVRPLRAGVEASDALALAAALEQRSEHPLAVALHAAARAAGVLERHRALDPVHTAGGGIEARVDGRLLRIGSPSFVAALATGAPGAGRRPAAADPRPTVVLGDAGGALASFAFDDRLRAGAHEFVRTLTGSGRRVLLLSGDRVETVAAVAAELGIDDARGALSPAGKLEAVRALQARGAVVAMLGDGVNDAPVLAQAQVSIAMASGTQLAQASADMVWMGSRLDTLAGAFRLCARTLAVARQNLMWAFGYNFIALPLAFAGLVTPWVAALGMSASSLLVVLNALRLQRGVAPRPDPAGAAPAPAGTIAAGTPAR
jgi:Cu2+-exporting ATPase